MEDTSTGCAPSYAVASYRRCVPIGGSWSCSRWAPPCDSRWRSHTRRRCSSGTPGPTSTWPTAGSRSASHPPAPAATRSSSRLLSLGGHHLTRRHHRAAPRRLGGGCARLSRPDARPGPALGGGSRDCAGDPGPLRDHAGADHRHRGVLHPGAVRRCVPGAPPPGDLSHGSWQAARCWRPRPSCARPACSRSRPGSYISPGGGSAGDRSRSGSWRSRSRCSPTPGRTSTPPGSSASSSRTAGSSMDGSGRSRRRAVEAKIPPERAFSASEAATRRRAPLSTSGETDRRPASASGGRRRAATHERRRANQRPPRVRGGDHPRPTARLRRARAERLRVATSSRASGRGLARESLPTRPEVDPGSIPLRSAWYAATSPATWSRSTTPGPSWCAFQGRWWWALAPAAALAYRSPWWPRLDPVWQGRAPVGGAGSSAGGRRDRAGRSCAGSGREPTLHRAGKEAGCRLGAGAALQGETQEGRACRAAARPDGARGRRGRPRLLRRARRSSRAVRPRRRRHP